MTQQVTYMSQQQTDSMARYYAKKHGMPTDDNDAIYKLINVYKELFDEIPTQEVEEGIAEYYRIISNRNLPAYLWILESFHVASKKDKSKRNFPYCVGMLRTWLKHGFGHIPNQEEDELVEYFEELTGYELSFNARQVLQTLMGNYGVVKIARMMNELKEGSNDMSLLLMLYLKEIIEQKFRKTSTEEKYQYFTDDSIVITDTNNKEEEQI